MQANLFANPRTIQDRFDAFHAQHPEVYRELVRIARLVKSSGLSHYSIDACVQRVRWFFRFEHPDRRDFKINDHFSSRYARLIGQREPDLRTFFETRKLKAE